MSMRYIITNVTFSLVHGMRDAILFVTVSNWFTNRYWRPSILRLFGTECGSGVSIGKCWISGSARNIKIGNNVHINSRVFLHAGGRLTIGNNVAIGFDSSLITGNHEVGPPSHRCGRLYHGDIVIEDGVWIASNVFIGPGVTIGGGCIVSAGAVVTRSMPPNCLIAGNPGRKVSALPIEENSNEDGEHAEG